MMPSDQIAADVQFFIEWADNQCKVATTATNWFIGLLKNPGQPPLTNAMLCLRLTNVNTYAVSIATGAVMDQIADSYYAHVERDDFDAHSWANKTKDRALYYVQFAATRPACADGTEEVIAKAKGQAWATIYSRLEEIL